jgi:hypothetical protein
MDIKSFMARRIYEFDIGKNEVYTSISFGIQLFLLIAIFIKSFFPNSKFIIYLMIGIAEVILYFFIWLIGYFLIKTGFYEQYQRHSPIGKKIFSDDD